MSSLNFINVFFEFYNTDDLINNDPIAIFSSSSVIFPLTWEAFMYY